MPTVLWRSCSREDLPNLVVPVWPATFACAAVQPDANSCRLCSGAHAQVKTCRTWWCRCGRQLLHAPLFNLTPTHADCALALMLRGRLAELGGAVWAGNFCMRRFK